LCWDISYMMTLYTDKILLPGGCLYEEASSKLWTQDPALTHPSEASLCVEAFLLVSKSFCTNRPYSMGSHVFCDIPLATTVMVSSGRQILLKGNPVQMCLPCSIRQCRKVCVPLGATMCASPQTTKVKALYWVASVTVGMTLLWLTFLHNDKPLSLLRKFRLHFLLRGITKGMNLLLNSSLAPKMTNFTKRLCYYWKDTLQSYLSCY
jgi:hypothetical protein